MTYILLNSNERNMSKVLNVIESDNELVAIQKVKRQMNQGNLVLIPCDESIEFNMNEVKSKKIIKVELGG